MDTNPANVRSAAATHRRRREVVVNDEDDGMIEKKHHSSVWEQQQQQEEASEPVEHLPSLKNIDAEIQQDIHKFLSLTQWIEDSKREIDQQKADMITSGLIDRVEAYVSAQEKYRLPFSIGDEEEKTLGKCAGLRMAKRSAMEVLGKKDIEALLPQLTKKVFAEDVPNIEQLTAKADKLVKLLFDQREKPEQPTYYVELIRPKGYKKPPTLKIRKPKKRKGQAKMEPLDDYEQPQPLEEDDL